MLKPKELVLVSQLRLDSRQTLKDLFKKTRLPMSTIHDKMRTWRKTGIIKQYTVKLDHAALGLHARAMVFFRLPKAQREEFSKVLAARPEIETFYRVNNGFDFLAEVAAKDFLALEALLDELEGRYAIQAKEAHYLLEEGMKILEPSRTVKSIKTAEAW